MPEPSVHNPAAASGAPTAPPATVAPPPPSGSAPALGSATYEIIRQRLQAQAEALRERMAQLDARRQEVFGSVEFKLLQSDRITTAHNCLPRDMVQLGPGRFLFGFNVEFGLKQEVELDDVFAIYARDEESGTFKEAGLDLLSDPQFLIDFKRLYHVYERTAFRKFSVIGSNLYMKFATGAGLNDFAVFKWAFHEGQLRFVDGRAETEYRRVGYPPAHEFRWLIPDRESYHYGDYPHVSIADRVFVECVGGDLTIKVEDNTASGEGIYAEPVDDRFQKVDDADLAYAIIDHLILLKIRPYRESTARFFIFNEKQQSVVRVDSLGQSCALLPEGHGLIFPDGYYLATGELKRFESQTDAFVLERIVHAPGGEDSLYVFYQRQSGHYVLMPYRLIAQRVQERIQCHGFSLFPDGHLLLFRADPEPQKHHTIQLRQTPFYQAGYEPPGQRDAFLYQVGNKEVVRCLAEINEVLTLIRREDPYADLYADLVKRTGAMLDAYPWLAHAEGFELDAVLRQVREVADKAVDEFDKVRRLQREAVHRVQDLRRRCDEQFHAVRRASFTALSDYVTHLAALRHLRGELITLKEVRYVDLAQIEETEQAVVARTDELSAACAQFLLRPESLAPYRQQADAQRAAVDQVTRVAEGRKIERAVADAGAELELLIEIVNSLRIEDATETTRIIDAITAVYATLNQVKAALKNRLQQLAATEGAAQFAAQLKLLGQSAASYLDLCDTPAKCDEYLNRVTVQLEEIEGAFADFEEYTVQLAERRTELYEAFEQRKLALIEQRNRRTAALMTAAERILKVIHNRLAGFKSLEEINTYMASDLMIAKVREIADQLLALEDAVKADHLQGRLKSVQQDAARQLKDRQELFVGGTDVIRLGKHRFNINTQPLDLTVVNRNGAPQLHLTSTRYFEPIIDPEFLAARDVWDQEVVSENRAVYRAEYLARRLLESLDHPSSSPAPAAAPDPAASDTEVRRSRAARSLTDALALSDTERLALVQEFAAHRYQEGYLKGVHDLDGARIFTVLLSTHLALGLARYHPTARACALAFWHRFCPEETRALWTAKLEAYAAGNRLFAGDPRQPNHIAALQLLVAGFIETTQLYPAEHAAAAGEYLFFERLGGDTFVISQEARELERAFQQHLVSKGSETNWQQARHSLAEHPVSELELVRDWVRGFLLDRPESMPYLDEVAAGLFCGSTARRTPVTAGTTRTLEDLKGSHPRIQDGRYHFDYLEFQDRLGRFEREVVPRFERYHQIKTRLLDTERRRLRLEEFQPRVLTSFVRNQLIDRVYLPVVGDNLAKQIGAAGDAKRTDLMGLLLLISPPGYGKTTLLEYLASRLGIIFVKINGPALGHAVTSLDPEEAPNAAAREEIHRLNLAFEMGDNIMLCVDDIQHCHAEFLQKFISLCDGQRKIEGVWRGQPRTYDLRGRKVVVVMAGNPYTESGQRFRLPDMLANRADTYNLGDIIGGNAEWFKASYVENAVTSNAVLAPLANRSQQDIRAFLRLAETGERDTDGFEGSYSAQEIEETLAVMKRLVTLRDVILRVNQEYIHSAAQADEFRTEPPFRLQGSYRNMNRLAEKIVPILNDAELQELILDHYRGEAQTLTTGAEANFLKFKELIQAQTAAEKTRWDEIKRTFQRNQITRGTGEDDPVSRVVGQLSAFQVGLEAIERTLQTALARAPAPLQVDLAPVERSLGAIQSALQQRAAQPQPATPPVMIDLAPVSRGLEALRAAVSEQLRPAPAPAVAAGPDTGALTAQLQAGLQGLREDLSRAITAVHSGTMADRMKSLMHELEMIHSTLATLKDIAARQRDHVRNVEDLLVARAREGTVELQLTQEMLENERAFLEQFQAALAAAQRTPDTPAEEPPHPGRS